MGRKKKGNVDDSSVALVQLDDEEPHCEPRLEPQPEPQPEPPSEQPQSEPQQQPEEQTPPSSSKKGRSRKEASTSNSGPKRNTRSKSGIVTLIPCVSDAAQSAVPQSETKRKRRRTTRSSPEDALSRIKRQVRYFYLRMKSEQNLIDAYSNDGWKGQSREKVRPEKELQRAQAQITKFKLRIREAIHELDTMLLEGSIRESAFDADGQLDYQEIFCACCHSHEAEVDNDIILCDGACNRGFHQRCLTPPLATEDIPPGDEGWLCPTCDCKADCVAFLNDHFGTEFEVETNWESFFPEAVPGSGVDEILKDLGSDESDDDDYDPEGKVEAEKTDAANGKATEEAKQPSSSDSSDNEGHENAGSEDSDDDDGDEDDSSSEGLSEEDLDQFLKEAAANNEEGGSEANGKESRPEQEEEAENESANADDSAAGTEAILSGKRRRRDVDYRKLHDEMFGMGLEPEDGLQSEDEDWGPLQRQTKRNDSSLRAARPAADADSAAEIPLDGQPTPPLDDRSKRIPKEAVERLRGAFAENQLPSRAFKEDLSRELGLSYRKVDVWFKNVRCQALRQGLAQPTRACPWKLKQQREHKDGMSLEDSSLLAKLSEVQFKLLDLRRTMQTDPKQKGKRIVYVPEASVVEKQS